MGSKKSAPVVQPVYAAKPRAIERTAEEAGTATSLKNRRNYGIDDTFMRAFAEAATAGANTLGS